MVDIEYRETEIASGKVRGAVHEGTVVYKGIPYAAPPIGDLRFAPPQKPKPWTDVLDCLEFGHCATQTPSILINTTPSEDCLYLNVWAPADAKPDDALPVVYWIHGGGYFNDCGTMNYYDGTSFAKQNVILVTFNYRLGALGFLGLKTLQDQYGTTGNWGTLDQIAALEWVHDNIAAFGGDPANVTIDGESAGSFSISGLVLSPKTKGLFRRAIMQSGSLFADRFAVPFTEAKLDKTIKMSQDFAQHFGAADSPDGLAALRHVDALTLWKTGFFSSDITQECPWAFWATLDGVVLPENPRAALEQGQVNGSEFIIGYNGNEGAVFISAASKPEGAKAYLDRVFPGEQGERVASLYEGIDPLKEVVDVVTYAYFKAGETLMKNALAAQGKTVYGYEFDYVPEGDYPMKQLGAHHAVEILYSFATSKAAGLTLGPDDGKVAEEMHRRWCNFAKTGDPNNVNVWPVPSGVVWQNHEGQEGPLLYLNAKTTCGPTADAAKIRLFMDML